jgi:hypothetical protein
MLTSDCHRERAAVIHGTGPPVDSRVSLLFEHRSKTGRTLPFFVASRQFEGSGKAPLLVRFTRALTPDERAEYARRGVSIKRTLSSGATKVLAEEEALAKRVADGVVARRERL